MTAAAFFFYLFGFVAVASALGMVLNVRNTVAAAMSLVVTMISLAGIYVLFEAHLVAAIQIMVYAGAIVVLFLFVVMLLNLRQDALPPLRHRAMRIAAVLAGAASLVGFLRLVPGGLPEPRALPEGYGGYVHLGTALYSDYVLPFEITSLLLLAAIVGAVVLAKRSLD